MLQALYKKFCFGGSDDGLTWNVDSKQHAFGDYSIAVIQANNILEDQSQVFTSPTATYAGVYDGHGGPEAARFATKRLLPNLHRMAELEGGLSEDVIKRAFLETDEEFYDLVRSSLSIQPKIVSAGSCCLVGVISDGVLYVANLGDSRAVLGMSFLEDEKRTVTAERLSTTHNVAVEEVRNELRALHPDDEDIVVLCGRTWRIKGLIQVSRSIGDVYLKKPEIYEDPVYQQHGIPISLERPIMTAEPSILMRRLSSEDSFLILASDGLWDYLSDEAAVEIVFTHPRVGIAKRLVRAAIEEIAKKKEMTYDQIKNLEKGRRRDFHDDITVIVIYLDKETGSSSNAKLSRRDTGFTNSPEDIFSHH